MNVSFALVSALLFLFPGFCCFVGFAFGGRMDRLSAVPDIPPQSGASLSIIVGGSILAHLAGSGLFYFQEHACAVSGACWPIAYDPNIYRAIIERDAGFVAHEGAIFFTLLGLVMLGAMSAWVASWISRSDAVQDFFRPTGATWLRDIARQAELADRVVIAHVLCKIGHNGMFAGYEGVVESMSPGPNGRVSNITLTGVDRFAAQIGYNGIIRRGSPQTVMSFLQLDHTEFSNVSFEIYKLHSQP